MLLFSIPFLLGDIIQQILFEQQTITMLIIVTAAALSLLLSKYRTNKFLFAISALFLGYAWTGWQITSATQWSLPHEWEGKPVLVRGVIISLPVDDKFGTNFIFKVNRIKYLQAKVNVSTSIKLSWGNASHARVGDSYEFHVRLKRIHGLRNPGGFDYEAFHWKTVYGHQVLLLLIQKLNFWVMRNYHL